MPLKPCLKSGQTPSSCLPANNYPPIPLEQDPASTSYFDYSPLPYAQPFVHFPPTPTLTSTYVVDPPRLYDRTPIVVAENECRLPQRGCPGRTYDASDKPIENHTDSVMHVEPSQMGSDIRPISGLSTGEGSSWDSDGLGPTPKSGYRNSLSPVSSFCHPLCSRDHHSPLCRTRATGRDNTDPRILFPCSSSPRSSRMRSVSASTTHMLPGPRKAMSSRLTPSFMSALDSSSCLGGF